MNPGEKQQAHPKAAGVHKGDELYYEHPRLGVVAGKVLSHGLHGCTLAAPGEKRHKVKWDNVHGHKKRGDQTYAMVDHGEDGLVVADNHGKRRFISTVENDAVERVAVRK